MSTEPSTSAGAREVDRQALNAALLGMLNPAREEFALAARAGVAGRAAHVKLAMAMDGVMRHLAERAGSDIGLPFVICAVGGYGRRTLCLHSDIDLLVVFDGAIGAGEER